MDLPDDIGSVSSQGSRRSERLRAKRSRDDASVSPGPPQRRQRRTDTPARCGRRASGCPPAVGELPMMELTTIPEVIATTTTTTATTNDPALPVVQQQQQQQARPELPLGRPILAQSHAPPVKPAEVPRVIGQLPPITPGRLQPSSTAYYNNTTSTIAVAPKSSKKLLSLDTKLETPFKRYRPRNDMDDDDENEQVESSKEKYTAPLIPNVPQYQEEPSSTMNQGFGRYVVSQYGHRLETFQFWFWTLLMLQLLFYPITIHPILSGTASLSRRLLHFYQSMLLPPEPDLMPMVQNLSNELAMVHEREKQAIRVLKHKRNELQNLVQEYITNSNAELAMFEASLPMVVNISRPILWSTTEEDCSHIRDGVSVAEAASTIRETYRKELEDLMKQSNVESWIQQHLPIRTVDRNVVRLEQTIIERLEHHIADFDYTEKVLTSTGNYVDQLPWGNRLFQLWGLRFYGNDASAAITPTTPRSSLGQCWSFIPPATMTIQLSKLIYVQSVAMEHPSTAPESSAARHFSVYAVDAQQRFWPLGNFEYNIVQKGRQDFMVRDEHKDEEIPPVKVVKLVVDSSWGGKNNYACLYRFRVFGEEEDGADE